MTTFYDAATQDSEWRSIFDYPELAPLRTRTVDGYRTTYLEAGRPGAPVVVLIHGGNFLTGMASDRWYPTVLPLAQHFHVFAIDELGSGGTDAPRDLSDLGDVQVRAKHVLQFVESLDVGPVHLVGQSQGAWIAAYVALMRPDLAGRVVLVDSASLALPAGGVGGPNIAPRFSENYLPGTMIKRSLEPTRQSLFEHYSSAIYEPSMLCAPLLERLTELAERWMPIWKEPWRAFWADGGDRNRRQYLVDGVHLGELAPRLQRPLVIWGKNSAKGLDNGIAFYRTLPGAQLHVFDHADHFLWLDQWKEFNSLVTWFLTRPS